VEHEQYTQIKAALEALTPKLTLELQAILRSDLYWSELYKDKLEELASQEVIRLRTLLLGAVQTGYAGLLGNQLRYIENVAAIRHYNLETFNKHLACWHYHLQHDLAPEHGKIVLEIFEQAVAQTDTLSARPTD
jgi:hypothetical protein